MDIAALGISSTSAVYRVISSSGLKSEGTFAMIRTGFQSFFDPPHIAQASLSTMESPGEYHLHIYYFLFDHGKKAHIINPLPIKNFQAMDTLRRTKTDKRDMGILTSIPCIGRMTTAHFFSEVTDISLFATYPRLIVFMGTDPGIYESGNTSKALKILKKGDAVLRKYGYLMADSYIKHNFVFNIYYYHKKRNAGFSHRKAMVAAMNKLMRTVHALLTKGEEYSAV